MIDVSTDEPTIYGVWSNENTTPAGGVLFSFRYYSSNTSPPPFFSPNRRDPLFSRVSSKTVFSEWGKNLIFVQECVVFLFGMGWLTDRIRRLTVEWGSLADGTRWLTVEWGSLADGTRWLSAQVFCRGPIRFLSGSNQINF